tara:strand:- start:188 stop:475 length:288 start_codon:yes stop_codon:yes gene_type:complete
MIRFFFYNNLKSRVLLSKVFNNFNIVSTDEEFIYINNNKTPGLLVEFDEFNLIKIVEKINQNKDILNNSLISKYFLKEAFTLKNKKVCYVLLPNN